MMAFMRLSGCARCVPSSTRLMLTWLPRLLASVLPASRKDTGMAATSDFFGQAAVLREVVAQGGGANPQHHVIERAAHALAHGLAFGQRKGGRDKHAARADAGVE